VRGKKPSTDGLYPSLARQMKAMMMMMMMTMMMIADEGDPRGAGGG
jgi:hypothetical protein